MKVSDYMKQQEHPRKGKKQPRHRTTYRAARRNIAKIEYRRAKRA